EFRHGQRLVYPRDGLFLFGPVGDVNQLPVIRYGVIGTKDGVRRFNVWSNTIRGYIPIPKPGPRSRSIEPQHVAFTGFREAFHAEWPMGPSRTIDDLDPTQIDRVLRIGNRHEAIRSTVDIFVNRLIEENNRLEHPPAVWFVVIPEAVYRLGRPRSVVPRRDRIQGTVTVSQSTARQLATDPHPFAFYQ